MYNRKRIRYQESFAVMIDFSRNVFRQRPKKQTELKVR